jgi:hypothetical protein
VNVHGGLRVLGRLKYVQLSHLVPEPSSFEVQIAVEKSESFLQSLSELEVSCFFLRFTYILILF